MKLLSMEVTINTNWYNPLKKSVWRGWDTDNNDVKISVPYSEWPIYMHNLSRNFEPKNRDRYFSSP